MSTNGATAAVTGGTGTQSTPANNVGGARRSSQSGLFSGLMDQKRNSLDAAARTRRESFHDQKPEAGFIGKMWNNFTLGPTTK